MVWSCLSLCEPDLDQTHRSLAISCWHTLSDQIVLLYLTYPFISLLSLNGPGRQSTFRAKSIKLNSLIPVKSSLRLIRSYPLYKSLAFIRHTRMTWVEAMSDLWRHSRTVSDHRGSHQEGHQGREGGPPDRISEKSEYEKGAASVTS